MNLDGFTCINNTGVLPFNVASKDPGHTKNPLCTKQYLHRFWLKISGYELVGDSFVNFPGNNAMPE